MSKRQKKWLKIIVFTILSALIQSFALVNFYKSSGLLSGGFTGVALIINKLTNGALSLSLFLLVINIPLAILGYFNIGKRFTILSFVNVVLTSFFLAIIPHVIMLDDILLNAIVGGVFFGIGVAMALEAGASTGGTDFIALYISVKKQVSAGQYMLMLNGIIILASAYFFDINVAVYTVISTYVSAKVIDSIHIRYQRITLAIITSKGQEVVDYLLSMNNHGVTILDAKGGFSNQDRKFIYTVISTYEIVELREGILEIDNNVFINITASKSIIGSFVGAKYD